MKLTNAEAMIVIDAMNAMTADTAVTPLQRSSHGDTSGMMDAMVAQHGNAGSSLLIEIQKIALSKLFDLP